MVLDDNSPLFFTHEAFYTLSGLSIVISLVTFLIVCKQVEYGKFGALNALIVLIFSKAYLDYSSSGFENPATHLLLASFLYLFIKDTADESLDGKSILKISLICGMAVLNRMDTFLFFLPPLGYIFVKQPGWKTLRNILLGFLPFIAWELFSLIYYGFPFPNTAYAKLNTGIARTDLIEQGILYVINSLNWDPITLLTILVGITLAALHGSWQEKTVALGAFSYFSYIVWIGGDYMSGRFLSGVLLVCVVLMSRQFVHLQTRENIIVFVMISALAFSSPTPNLISVNEETLSTGRKDINGIIDWRSYSFQTSGLLYIRKGYLEPYHEWALRGLEFKRIKIKYLTFGNIGYVGYFAGPYLHIIDPNALSDPLLARLKPIGIPDWQAGHFTRAIPEGYLETLRNGTNYFTNEDLAEYYQKISIIVSGPLFSWDRFTTIWYMNTGQYDYLIEGYNSSQVVQTTQKQDP